MKTPKHAPRAPGPRLNTWWKKQRYAAHVIIGEDVSDYKSPPVYTKPDKPKQNKPK